MHRLDPTDVATVRTLMGAHRPDGIVCANDWTAPRLLHAILALGYAVPQDVRLVGIDNVDYGPAPGTAHDAEAASPRDRRGGARRHARSRLGGR